MPYTATNQYMSWAECRARCPRGAIQYRNHHYQLDAKLCDRCHSLKEYPCGGIFVNNSPYQLEDFNTYWREWFTHYNQLVHRLHQKGGRA
ncbi:hypothetical protein [Synechococcus sp. C9]|uniref:hypothetical protein n=1 Tax=Synechococcus sp. C9 TaxID=102119 RepID=UPI001FF208B7|nr:hypothetical protein [Synechococcus sp. C9]